MCAAVLGIGHRLATFISPLQSTSNICRDPFSMEGMLSHLLLRRGKEEMGELHSLRYVPEKRIG